MDQREDSTFANEVVVELSTAPENQKYSTFLSTSKVVSRAIGLSEPEDLDLNGKLWPVNKSYLRVRTML